MQKSKTNSVRPAPRRRESIGEIDRETVCKRARDECEHYSLDDCWPEYTIRRTKRHLKSTIIVINRYCDIPTLDDYCWLSPFRTKKKRRQCSSCVCELKHSPAASHQISAHLLSCADTGTCTTGLLINCRPYEDEVLFHSILVRSHAEERTE